MLTQPVAGLTTEEEEEEEAVKKSEVVAGGGGHRAADRTHGPRNVHTDRLTNSRIGLTRHVSLSLCNSVLFRRGFQNKRMGGASINVRSETLLRRCCCLGLGLCHCGITES